MLDQFSNVIVVLTRDKYTIPPYNYLVEDSFGNCYVNVAELDEERQYASLGQPFVEPFYTSLNYEQDLVFFAVSSTVTVRGVLNEFPPMVMMYLGLTIAVLPPIIVAFCMSYHYCPTHRSRQRVERIKKWQKELEKTNKKLRKHNINLESQEEFL